METIDLSQYTLVQAENIELRKCKDEIFYDITVEDAHTFFIDQEDFQVLTHNCDGNAISFLLVNMFHYFWPELFALGAICKFNTPIVRVFLKNETINFYDLDEYHKWVDQNQDKKYTQRYYKGVGTSTAKDFKEYLANTEKHLFEFTVENDDDRNSLKLAFSKEAGYTDKRKEWLALR